MESYTFSVSQDFASGVAEDRLATEIAAEDAITRALDGVSVNGDVCTVVFKAALDAAEVTALNALIAAHSGIRLPPSALIVDVTGPKEEDGKQLVTINPATEGLKTWLHSRGDDLAQGASGRGKGVRLSVEFLGNETFPCTKSVDIQYREPVEIHDGQFNWSPVAAWGVDDEFSVAVVMPASAPAETPGTGNIQIVSIGGGAYAYVPAAGNGSHTLDLTDMTKTVPVPAAGKDGYWDVDDEGVVVPSGKPGQADWHLLSVSVEVFMVAGVVMHNALGLFDVDVYKTEWVHQSWKIKLSVLKATSGAGCASGWLLGFRKHVTRT